jgi:hypothetical protein
MKAASIVCALLLSAPLHAESLSIRSKCEPYDQLAERLEKDGFSRGWQVDGVEQLKGFKVETWLVGWGATIALVATNDGQKTGCLLGRGENGKALSPRPKTQTK